MRPAITVATTDLRELRTTFLGKATAYALSYDCRFDPASQLRSGDLKEEGAYGLPPKLGSVFHVFGASRVEGLDELGHDLPKDFAVSSVEETVRPWTFERDRSAGGPPGEWATAFIAGRLFFDARNGERTDGVPVRISVTYEGILRFEDQVTLSELRDRKKPVRARAFINPVFATIHPKYHWLVENVCIAFGLWERLDDGSVKATYDVYSAE